MYRSDRIMEQQREYFKDHVAQYWKLQGGPNNGGVEMIRFQKPGTINYFIEFLFTNGTLFVRGDLGEAVYCWHYSMGLRQLGKVGRGYMKGKCQASEKGRDFDAWDDDELIKVIRERLEREDNERLIGPFLDPTFNPEEQDSDDIDWADLLDDCTDEQWAEAKKRYIEAKLRELEHVSLSDEHEWVEFCREKGEEFFNDQDHWEYSYSLGRVTHTRMIIHHLALTMAVQQLEEQNAFDVRQPA